MQYNITYWIALTIEGGWFMNATDLWRIALLFAGWSLHGDAQEKPTYEVTFAQLTDAHIFDDGYKQPTPDALRQAANDRTALHWAIEQVNREVESGTKIDFVVYTGDLGLQNVDFREMALCHTLPFRIDPGLPPSPLSWAVKEVADEINQLEVRRILFVAGNNDIQDEDVTDQRFDCFMTELQKRFQSSTLQVDTLRPDRGVEINGIRIAGLNTASFKKQKNYKDACARSDSPLPQACPKPQMESLRKLAESDAKAPLILFTHVPDLIDPFFHKNNPGARQSAWDIPGDIRSTWEQEVCGSNVIAVFAGHLHDSDRTIYGSNSHYGDLAYTRCIAGKTWIAPPLALKNQERPLTKARGFLLVRVAGGKVADVQPRWFEGPAPVAAAAIVNTEGSAVSSVQSQPVTILGLIVGLDLVAGFLGFSWLFWRVSKPWLRDVQAFTATIAFVLLALMVAWFAQSQLGVANSAALILLGLCPLLVYGVALWHLTRRVRQEPDSDKKSDS
jgi:predicted MPP superfamily phosphohydrolase